MTKVIDEDYEFHKSCKNSVCYKPKKGSKAEGMTLYLPNQFMKDHTKPPSTVRVTVEL